MSGTSAPRFYMRRQRPDYPEWADQCDWVVAETHEDPGQRTIWARCHREEYARVIRDALNAWEGEG